MSETWFSAFNSKSNLQKQMYSVSDIVNIKDNLENVICFTDQKTKFLF